MGNRPTGEVSGADTGVGVDSGEDGAGVTLGVGGGLGTVAVGQSEALSLILCSGGPYSSGPTDLRGDRWSWRR